MQKVQQEGDYHSTVLEPVECGSPSGFTVAKLSFINNRRRCGEFLIPALSEESCTIDMNCEKLCK